VKKSKGFCIEEQSKETRKTEKKKLIHIQNCLLDGMMNWLDQIISVTLL
jgi:hypothetical protein